MTSRHTVDTITSDALDQMYDQLDAAEAAITRVRAVAGWAIQGWSDLSPEKVLLAVEGHQPAPAPAATQAPDDRVLHFDHRLSESEVEEIKARWRERYGHRFTALPVDPDAERAATERAVKAAADSERAAEWVAAHSTPREHCGDLSPDTGLSTVRTECVLRPGHQGSHADDVGCRWWCDPTGGNHTDPSRVVHTDSTTPPTENP